MPISHTFPRTLFVVLLSLALLGPLFALAPPARAEDPCVVRSEEDDGAGSLRVAVDTVANEGCAAGTITFAAGIDEVRLSSALRIDRALTIQGPGMGALTLRYTGASSASGNVVTITSTPVVLRDLTVADGKVTDRGGGIRIAPSAARVVDVTLERVRIASNASAARGGGLFATNTTLQITDSIIEGNQAGTIGGGVYFSDITGRVEAQLTDTVIVGNTTLTSNGGGIMIAHDETESYPGMQVELLRTTVGTPDRPNNAGYAAGGIFNDQGELILTNSTISGNTAYRDGGLLNVGTATLIDSTVSGNTAYYGPGGIKNEGTLALTGSTVNGNTSTYSPGAIQSDDTMTLTNSTISGNSSRDSTGGIQSYGGKATLAFVTMTDNTSDGDVSSGGIAAYDGAEFTVASSIIAGNRRGPVTPSDCTAGITSQGHNLWGDQGPCPVGPNDQNLATLQQNIATVINPTLADNGGPTPTHNLVPGGPARDKADNLICPVPIGKDQRGYDRPAGACDIGAVEYTVAPPSPTPSPSPPTGPCGTRFGDVPADSAACAAIEGLAARGVINGCDSSVSPPLFCPNDPTLRHQMAALIVRAIPDWAGETGLPSFTDNTEDTELMTRVATLQRHNVVRGYQDEVCTDQGKTPPCYGPLDTVKYGQVLLFIARAMVERGYWTLQPDDRTIFPDQNGPPGADPDIDQQTRDHRMVVTYVHYVGNPPDVADVRAPFLRGGVAAGGWGDDSSRAWFARAFWPAIKDR